MAQAEQASYRSNRDLDGTEPVAPVVYRMRLPVRLWHGINALCIFVLLMSGFTIFNAHPRLYWGEYGANYDTAWLEVGHRGQSGFVDVSGVEIPTTGVLGWTGSSTKAFPPLATIPSRYDLAAGREWHFFFAWLLAGSLACFLVYAIATRHLMRDIIPARPDLRPARLWHDIVEHARLRFSESEAARGYNPLQKIAYSAVLLVFVPLAILTGLAMSPALNAAFPWMLDLAGGRQSARSIHFLCAAGLAAFIAVHVIMVVLAGPVNGLRTVVTGWYRLPGEKGQ